MDIIAITFFILSIILFVIFVLIAFSILGLWLSEIGLWFSILPLFMLGISFIEFVKYYTLPDDRLNIIFLSVSCALNIVTLLRIFLPFIIIRKVNKILQMKMSQSLGADYLEYVDPFIDSSFFRSVKFQFKHYLIGVRKRALDKQIVTVIDLTYQKTSETELKLNVYYPKRDGIFPTITFVHGGGFVVGSKDDPKQEKFCKMLANYGYTVFNIDYHLTPLKYLTSKEASMKDDLLICDMVTDIRKSMVYAKEHAAKYKGNPDEFFVFGRSAGGHLALLTAFSCLGKFYDMKQKDGTITEHSISGVVAFYPVTDFTSLYDHYGKQNLAQFFMKRGVGGSPDELSYLYKAFSPMSYVTHKNLQSIPPTFLATGDRDRLVSPEQSRKMFTQLQSLGIKSVLLNLPWANHSFDTVINGPGGQLVIKYLTQFLVWVITKIKFEKIETLAKQYGLVDIISKEKYHVIREFPKWDFTRMDDSVYNKPFFDHIYQTYVLDE